MKTLTASQEKARDRRRLKPVWLLDIALQNSGPTLHISDRNIIVGSTVYENYLDDLSGLGAQLKRRTAESRNINVSFTFKNRKYSSYDYLILIGDSYPFEGAMVTIKKVYLDDDNGQSDVLTVEKVTLDEPMDIDRLSFRCTASSMPYAMDELWKQNTINETDYSNADPDDLNKTCNIIYGSCEQVRCHAIDAGAMDTLAEDITSSQTSFDVSNASGRKMPSGTIVIQIENEKIQGSFSGNTFSVSSRGYGGTTAVAHDKGMKVFEVLTEYVYLVADHPVKAIGDIYVDGIRQQSGFTKYTGQSGDEHSTYTGMAVITFSAKPVIQKQVNLSANKTGSANNGTLAVTDNIAVSLPKTSKTVYPNSGTAALYNGVTSDPVTANGTSVGFPSENLGTIDFQELYVYRPYATGYNITASGWGTIIIAAGWHRFTKSGGSWNDGVSFSSSGGEISEVYKVITYTPNNPKSGNAYKSGDVSDNIAVSLAGNSSADVVVGASVNCDVDGYRDDGSGTYTGSANALIERPDHVRKHFIDVLYGFALSDIDSTSFSTAGSSYASAISGGYKFAFVIDREIVPSKFMQELDAQSRSACRYRGAKWYLDYLPDTAPSADKTISASRLAGEGAQFVFSKTDRREVVNDFTARFKRNYGRLKYDDSEWLGTSQDSDSTSQTKYGVRPSKEGQFDFWAVRLQAMADHVLAFIKLQHKNTLLRVTAPVFWENLDLDDGDTFDISNDLYNAKKFYIEEIQYIDKFQGLLVGLEWW